MSGGTLQWPLNSHSPQTPDLCLGERNGFSELAETKCTDSPCKGPPPRAFNICEQLQASSTEICRVLPQYSVCTDINPLRWLFEGLRPINPTYIYHWPRPVWAAVMLLRRQIAPIKYDGWSHYRGTIHLAHHLTSQPRQCFHEQNWIKFKMFFNFLLTFIKANPLWLAFLFVLIQLYRKFWI